MIMLTRRIRWLHYKKLCKELQITFMDELKKRSPFIGGGSLLMAFVICIKMECKIKVCSCFIFSAKLAEKIKQEQT